MSKMMMKDEATEAALRKVIQARSNLVLDEPFFGTLALRLDLTPDPTCKTFWTDGKKLAFNPAYVESLSLAEIQGVVCHEVMHNANGHPWRRGGRDRREWNEDTDYAINPVIVSAKQILPVGGLFDPQFDGLSAEEVHARRQQQPQQQSPKSQEARGGEKTETDETNGEGESGEQQDQEGQEERQGQQEDERDQDFGCGEVRDCTDEDAPTQEAEWQVAVIQAAQAAKAQGKLPAGIEHLVEEIRRPKIDWRAALRRFAQTCARADFTWRQPNRRYVASGLYLPALRSEQMPPIVFGWDTSGSRDYEEARAECAAEVVAIFDEMKPEKLYVPYFDTEVPHVDEFEAGDIVEFHPKGGGGTDFRSLFSWVEKQQIEPACLVVLTDLMGTFPQTEPEYPVLWISTTERVAPFGETLRLTED